MNNVHYSNKILPFYLKTNTFHYSQVNKKESNFTYVVFSTKWSAQKWFAWYAFASSRFHYHYDCVLNVIYLLMKLYARVI